MHLVIVGNGVAGITCAMEARQRDPALQITVVSGETDYFFSRTALMYAFMDRMQRRDLEPFERRVYDDKRIQRIRDWVVDLDADQRLLTLQSGQTLRYDRLVLAVGAAPRRPSWDGLEQVKDGLVNFVSMQDLDACERMAPSTRQAIVVGGGLIGIELVECFRHLGIPTTFMVREPYYWPVALAREEADYVANHMRNHGVELMLSEELRAVQADSAGRISAVITKEGKSLPCQMLGVCIGVDPAIERIKAFKTPPALGRGIVVDEQFRTNLPDVYACGDCAELHLPGGKKLVELIWYSAKRHGRMVAAAILGDAKPYSPPLFFNSSKFFEIEYTTVGEVVNVPDGTPSIYRKDPTRDISQRIVHDGERVLGFNMLGSRWNHEVLQGWVQEQRSPAYVREHLAEAQYDVEFGRVPLHRFHEQELPMRKRNREVRP